jgi:hypothetical protein
MLNLKTVRPAGSMTSIRQFGLLGSLVATSRARSANIRSPPYEPHQHPAGKRPLMNLNGVVRHAGYLLGAPFLSPEEAEEVCSAPDTPELNGGFLTEKVPDTLPLERSPSSVSS